MKPSKILYFVLATSLFLVAVVDQARGLLIPQFKQVFHLTSSEIGVLLFFSSLVYVVGIYLVGRTVHIFSYKSNLIFAIIVALFSLLLLFQFQSLIAFVIGMLLIVWSTAQLSIIVNLCVPRLNILNHAVIINMTHFMYGAGSTLTQKGVGTLLDANESYTQIYFYIFMIFALFLPIVLMSKFEESDRSTHFDLDVTDEVSDLYRKHQNDTNKKLQNYDPKIEKRLVITFMMVMGLYIVGEAQTATWFYTYIIENYGNTPGEATNFTSIFFLSLTFGRLFGGFVVEKIGQMKSVLLSFIFAAVMYLIGIMLGQYGLILIAASGIFFSIIYPTLVISYGKYFKDPVRTSSIIISGASAVNMVMNYLMGVLNDSMGSANAMCFIPICFGIAILGLLRIRAGIGFRDS